MPNVIELWLGAMSRWFAKWPHELAAISDMQIDMILSKLFKNKNKNIRIYIQYETQLNESERERARKKRGHDLQYSHN
jgi:hypothetical protein